MATSLTSSRVRLEGTVSGHNSLFLFLWRGHSRNGKRMSSAQPVRGARILGIPKRRMTVRAFCSGGMEAKRKFLILRIDTQQFNRFSDDPLEKLLGKLLGRLRLVFSLR